LWRNFLYLNYFKLHRLNIFAVGDEASVAHSLSLGSAAIPVSLQWRTMAKRRSQESPGKASHSML